MSRKVISFWLIVIPDAALFCAGLWLSVLIRYPGGLQHGEAVKLAQAFSVLFLLWLLVFFIHGLFEAKAFRRYVGLVFNLVSACLVNLLLSIIYFYFQKNLIITPRRFLLLDLSVTFVLVLGWHILVKYFLKNALVEGVYIFASGGEAVAMEQELVNHNYLGYKSLGQLNEQNLGSMRLEKNSVVILPDNVHANPEISRQLYLLRTHGVTFYNYKDFYEFLLRRIYLSDLNELWFLENINYQEKRFYNITKRLLDIVFGVILFIALLISYPFIAVALKLDSKGPVLFTQKRVGKNGTLFSIYKYRSMVTVTDTSWTQKNDPRITKVGNILRKTRLDELPQCINLIVGDISLVGPRPEQPGIVEQLRTQIPFYDERHLVKPGAFGWAQLNIYAGSLEETRVKLQYDLYYIKHRSFLFDLEIILKTIYYIFTWQGR